MAQKQLVQIPAIIEDFKPKRDRSWKLVFETRQLTGEEVKLLADNFQGEGWLVYSPNEEVTISDVPNEKAESGTRSPAQRLYGKLFIYWKALGSQGDFDSFYRTKIQQFIEVIDSKIPEGK